MQGFAEHNIAFSRRIKKIRSTYIIFYLFNETTNTLKLHIWRANLNNLPNVSDVGMTDI